VGVTCKKAKGIKRLLKTDAALVRLRSAQKWIGIVDGVVFLAQPPGPAGPPRGAARLLPSPRARWSGCPMESMCGVTTGRIKGRGRRWDLENAEAMMALEAVHQSTGHLFRISFFEFPPVYSGA